MRKSVNISEFFGRTASPSVTAGKGDARFVWWCCRCTRSVTVFLNARALQGCTEDEEVDLFRHERCAFETKRYYFFLPCSVSPATMPIHCVCHSFTDDIMILPLVRDVLDEVSVCDVRVNRSSKLRFVLTILDYCSAKQAGMAFPKTVK